jgi:hypothetical protein
LEAALPRYKIPRVFLPWPADLTAHGIKPNRSALAELAVRLTQHSGQDGER